MRPKKEGAPRQEDADTNRTPRIADAVPRVRYRRVCIDSGRDWARYAWQPVAP